MDQQERKQDSEQVYTKIERHALDHTVAQEKPRAILLGGQPGSGKSELARMAQHELSQNGRAVVIDADKLRERNPAYWALSITDPKNAADLTHKEAAEWARRLTTAAVKGRRNLVFGDGVFLVVVDNTTARQLHHGGWGALDTLKQEGDREHIRERLFAALERGYRQGRFNDGFYRQAAGREPEKSRERQESYGDRSADRRGIQADGTRPGIPAGDPEKDSLSLQTLEAEATRLGLILRDGERFGRSVQGEVVAGSSQHVLVKVSDMVALSYERDRLDRAVSDAPRVCGDEPYWGNFDEITAQHSPHTRGRPVVKVGESVRWGSRHGSRAPNLATHPFQNPIVRA